MIIREYSTDENRSLTACYWNACATELPDLLSTKSFCPVVHYLYLYMPFVQLAIMASSRYTLGVINQLITVSIMEQAYLFHFSIVRVTNCSLVLVLNYHDLWAHFHETRTLCIVLTCNNAVNSPQVWHFSVQHR